MAEHPAESPLNAAPGADATQTVFRAFTPAYASPEQILGKSVTTASDVFSLGVILYELLTNEKPFHFEGQSLDEIIRTVTTGKPSLPSKAVHTGEPELLGSVLMENGDLANAGATLIEGEGLYRKLYGPEYLPIYDNIRVQAQVAYLNGDYHLAKNKIDLALDNYRKNSIPKNISFATALTVQGLTLNKLGRSDEAEKVLREAVKLREDDSPEQGGSRRISHHSKALC